MTAGWLLPYDDSGPGLSSAGSADRRRVAGRLIVGLMLMAVSAVHAASCTITTLTGAAFGGYDPISANSASPLDGVATATIDCTSTKKSETLNVSVSLSTGLSGSYSTRQMQGTNPLNTLNYNLYIDAARTQIMGNGTGGSVTDNGSASISKNSPVSFTETIYGRVPAGQDTAVGNYNDTLIYTLNF